jgi:hypothetical protein
LVEAFSGPRDALEELHVDLQSVAGLALFVTLPALSVGSMLLVGRQTIDAVLA